LAAESFTMRDGERTIRFGEGTAAEAPGLLSEHDFEGYTLLTTPRAAGSAPLEPARTLEVPSGVVDEISAEHVRPLRHWRGIGQLGDESRGGGHRAHDGDLVDAVGCVALVPCGEGLDALQLEPPQRWVSVEEHVVGEDVSDLGGAEHLGECRAETLGCADVGDGDVVRAGHVDPLSRWCDGSHGTNQPRARASGEWRIDARRRRPQKYRCAGLGFPRFARCAGPAALRAVRTETARREEAPMSEHPNVTTVNRMTQAIVDRDSETLTAGLVASYLIGPKEAGALTLPALSVHVPENDALAVSGPP